jgi:hypothetical protein
MKGPGNRVKFVIRRVWECPLCQRRLVTPGATTRQTCNCRADSPVPMRLVNEALRTSRKDVPT